MEIQNLIADAMRVQAGILDDADIQRLLTLPPEGLSSEDRERVQRFREGFAEWTTGHLATLHRLIEAAAALEPSA